MNVKLAVENFLDNEKVVIPSANNLANYEHKFIYKNREAIFENFNTFGRVTSLNMFKSMWKDADAKIYQCVKEDYFMVVFDYTMQYETLTNVYSPFGSESNDKN